MSERWSSDLSKFVKLMAACALAGIFSMGIYEGFTRDYIESFSVFLGTNNAETLRYMVFVCLITMLVIVVLNDLRRYKSRKYPIVFKPSRAHITTYIACTLLTAFLWTAYVIFEHDDMPYAQNGVAVAF